MTLDLDHAEAIALLQPFVDGELGDDERALVARQIADNPEYQAFVREQQQVRAALQSLRPELAPAGLRERVIADLEQLDPARDQGRLAPIVGRIKSFGRGALLMVPAAAAAGVLFLVASNFGWLSAGGSDSEVAGHVDAGVAESLPTRPRAKQTRRDTPAPLVAAVAERADASLPSAEALADNIGFAVQVAPPRALPRDVALVSDAAVPTASLSATAIVRYRVGDGAVVVDRQRRAGPAEPGGPGQVFRGHVYQLTRDDLGRPCAEFQVAGVHHNLVLEGGDARIDAGVGVQEADFRVLMLVADAIRQEHG